MLSVSKFVQVLILVFFWKRVRGSSHCDQLNLANCTVFKKGRMRSVFIFSTIKQGILLLYFLSVYRHSFNKFQQCLKLPITKQHD